MWNHPQTEPKDNVTCGASRRYGVVTAMIVVAVVAACVCLVIGRTSSPESDGEKSRRGIPEVRARLSRFGERTARFEDVTRTNAPAGKGAPQLDCDNPIVRQKIRGRVVKWQNFSGTPVFTNRFECLVSEILLATPGDRFLDLDIDESYDEAFRESLDRPIMVEQDDSDEVRAMKQTVIEAKAEMQKLMADGRKASEILAEARNELNKIADYRDELQKKFNDLLKTETNPNELLKCAKEMNELLAEYDAQELEAPESEDEAYEMMIAARETVLDELDRKDELERKRTKEDGNEDE